MAKPRPMQYYYLTLLALFCAFGGIFQLFAFIIGVSNFLERNTGGSIWATVMCIPFFGIGFLIMRTAWRASQRYQARIEDSN
jgi:hypothetical protein